MKDKYKLKIKFQGLDWKEYNFILNDFSTTEILHKDLKPADASCQLSLLPNIELNNLLLGMGEFDIQAQIIKNNKIFFTGYLKKNFTIPKAQKLQPVKIEIVSGGYLLKQKVGRDVFIKSKKTVSATVKEILDLAGINHKPIPQINDVLYGVHLKPDDSYHKILTDILFEYGYAFIFDKEGKLDFINLFLNNPQSEHLINGRECLDLISLNHNERKKTEVSTEWAGVEIVEDSYAFKETAGAQMGYSCYIELLPAAYYRGAPDGIYIPYQSNQGEVIFAENVTLEIDGDMSNIAVQNFEPLNTKAFIKVKNMDNSFSNWIRKLNFKAGKVYVKKTKNKAKAANNTTNDKRLNIQAKYIYTKVRAEILSKDLLNYYNLSNITYKFKTIKDYKLGAVVSIQDKNIGTGVVRILEKKTNVLENYIEYTAETVGAYTPPSKTESEIEAEPQPPQNGNDGKDGTTKFLSSLEVQGDYENQIGTHQGQLYRWVNNKWELLNAVMPINPVCYYDFENLPEFPDNLNDTYNKHFCNWKQKGKKISTPENMGWICVRPNSNQRLVTELGDGIFTVEVLKGYSGGYITPFDNPNRILNKIVYMKFKVLKGKFRIGAESDCEDFTPNDGTQTISRFMYKDKDPFIYYASAGSKIFIEEILLIDRVFNDNYYSFGNEFNSDENRRRITVNEKGNFTVEIKNKTVSGFYFVENKKYADKIITLKFKVLKGDWYIGTEYWKFGSDYEGYKGYWYKQGEEKTVCIAVDFEASLIVLSSAQGSKIEFSNIYIGDGSYKNNIVIDNSGNGNHGQLAGGCLKTRDEKVGTCLIFNKGGIHYKNRLTVGKQWCHSRWLKMDESSVLSFLYSYGSFDYYKPVYNEVKTVAKSGGVCNVSLPANSLRNKGFIHLVIQTDLQQDYCEKEVYINGVLYSKNRREGDFSKVISEENTELYYGVPNCKNVSLANLLFFDRFLTEQEILWLYLNPQYPVKNYTLADWSISSDNPDNVLALHTPRYLGTVKTPPEGARVNIALGPKNGFNDASIGDWVLIIETLAAYQKGWCYRWTGSVWQKLDPPANYTAEYSVCLKDQLEKCKDLFGDTNFFGAVFCQFLGFNKAVGESLAANTALLDNLTVKRLLVDNDTNDPLDFELAINREVGILAKNNGETVFEVTPLGNVYAKNAFLQDGIFTGEIFSGPLRLSPQKPTAKEINVKASETAKDICNRLGIVSYSVKSKDGIDNIHGFHTYIQELKEDYESPGFGIVGWRKTRIYYVFIPPNNDKAVFGETIDKGKYPVLWWGPIPDVDFSKINRNFTRDYHLEVLSGGKTFVLLDLPKQEPALTGAVWTNGSDGILRIKD